MDCIVPIYRQIQLASVTSAKNIGHSAYMAFCIQWPLLLSTQASVTMLDGMNCSILTFSQLWFCCRSQQLADLLDLPTDNMTEDPATPKGQQTAYNGVYILQQPKEEGPKKSRFGTRDQVNITLVLHLACQSEGNLHGNHTALCCV